MACLTAEKQCKPKDDPEELVNMAVKDENCNLLS